MVALADHNQAHVSAPARRDEAPASSFGPCRVIRSA